MNIRYATIDDIHKVHLMGQGVSEFSVNNETVNFWPESLLQNALLSKDTYIIVAEENKEIVGFIIALYNEGFKKATIENIYVAPGFRGRGIGKLLLEKIQAEVTKRKCEYIATLIPLDADEARGLYESSGFSRGEQFLWLDKTLDDNFKRAGG